tara:strand:+ start:1124 stop:1246 length:123 start_codon:yes stop_codon:yes gene_type:complete
MKVIILTKTIFIKSPLDLKLKLLEKYKLAKNQNKLESNIA